MPSMFRNVIKMIQLNDDRVRHLDPCVRCKELCWDEVCECKIVSKGDWAESMATFLNHKGIYYINPLIWDSPYGDELREEYKEWMKDELYRNTTSTNR